VSGRVYLDHNASTPLCPPAREALLEAIDAATGNPSAPHWAGREAAALLDEARGRIAAAFDVTPGAVIATSGGSESDNQALLGLWRQRPAGRDVVVVSAIEHPAISAPAAVLAAEGAELRELPVTAEGVVSLERAREQIDQRVAVVSVMHAHNETGVIQPIAELAELAHEAGAPIHCDTAQTVGKIPVSLPALGVDLLTVAGHKFGAPKGVGALVVREGLDIPPLIHGAGHEGGRRAGTENLLLLAALGAACAAIPDRLAAMERRVRPLRDRLEDGLRELWGERVHVLGAGAERLPNTSFVALRDLDAAAIRAACPDLALSGGSACHGAGSARPAILDAMDLGPEWMGGTLRCSLGPETGEADIATALAMLEAAT